MKTLIEKLNPNRFPNMSGKMAAIVGYLTGEKLTSPAFSDIQVTSDDCVLGQHEDDCGFNEFIGSFEDLRRNFSRLFQCARLTEDEKTTAEKLFLAKFKRSI